MKKFLSPRIIYRRSESYRQLTPLFDEFVKNDGASDIDSRLNLCDYWDNIDGIAYESFKAIAAGRKPVLRRLSAFITESCNLNCSYCRRLQETSRTIDIDWLRRNIREARQRGAVFLDIMGLGEPTIVDDLPRILETAAAAGMICTIGTNGTTDNLLRPDYLSRLFDAAHLKFRVSLNGAQPGETNDPHHDKAAWRRVVGFLDSLVTARENGRLKAGIFINKVLSAANAKTLLEDLKFMAELGVDDIHLIPIKFDTEQFFAPESIRRFNREIAPEIRELGKRYKLAWLRHNAYPLGRDDEEIELACRGRYYKPAASGECYVMKGQIVVDPLKRPYTCLWGRRAGGRPLSTENASGSSLTALHDRAVSQNYCDVNPDICRNYCTRRVIELNDRVARQLEGISRPGES